ncbi:MAG: polysaccharide deacetylase family protein [Rhodospirillales bacterium]|nr:polysaccharide deacetylase family protein [Rhodospirillales bacterium]MBO6787258.1 polysaccharide deacetylase family protein [Rhodospirillales bacterium]
MKRVTLTFDNGPEPDITHGVLDELGARGIGAVFFVIGRKLDTEAGLEAASRAHAEGHIIGNHTWSHTTPLGEIFGDPAIAENEIGRTQEAIGACAHADKLFRPFGGGGAISERLLNKRCFDYLKDDGYSCVLWNNVPGDWKDPDGWVETALETLADQDWSVIVIHGMDTGAMAHLARFLDELDGIGVEYRQDFPDDCMPMVRGEVVRDMTAFVSDHI